jgi:hypothetical protein
LLVCLLDGAEDRNGFVDFSEYLVLSKMFHGHFSELDKARFWWWVALYTDSGSVNGGEKDAIAVVGPLCRCEWNGNREALMTEWIGRIDFRRRR